MFAKVALEQMSPEEGARTAEREIKRIFELNASPTLEHLELLFYETLYPRWLLDTRLVGLLVVAITLLPGRAGRLQPRAADGPRRRAARDHDLPDLYNYFLDRLSAGFTVGAIK